MIFKRILEGLGCAVLVTVCAGSAVAQDGNVIVIEQEGEANSLRVDQTRASNSLVAGVPAADSFGSAADFGLSLDPDEDAESFVVFGNVIAANGNTLNIVDRGSSATQSGTRNSASITLEGNGSFAGLEQLGDRNEATIDVNGNSAGGIIVQSGNRNSGSVSVTENGAFGELIQIGSDNVTAFSVSGNPNASVSFTVQGDAISSSVPASVVTSSGGQVTIVQRQLGAFN